MNYITPSRTDPVSDLLVLCRVTSVNSLPVYHHCLDLWDHWVHLESFFKKKIVLLMPVLGGVSGVAYRITCQLNRLN